MWFNARNKPQNDIFSKTVNLHIRLFVKSATKCNTFPQSTLLKQVLSPPMYLCGIHNFNKGMFQKGVIFFNVMTSI